MGLDNVMAEGQACAAQITLVIKARVLASRQIVEQFYIKKIIPH